ncbi:MAG: 3-deoxy-manno-octulosonate cytidylyltransferase [bacterium]
MKAIGIIPARFKAVRFPGKPLADLLGKPVIQWVYERARGAKLLNDVIVATDDERIARAVRDFGGNVEMTSPEHKSGTDRIAEVARRLPDVGIVINIQGDEPIIHPDTIDAVAKPLLEDDSLQMCTCKFKIEDEEDLRNPNVTKVVTDSRGYALYFSRAPIPYKRDEGLPGVYYRHVGLYGYRRDFLLKYAEMPQGTLERSEKLEQLRVLEWGYKIKVVEVHHLSIGVDTPEDLERVRRILMES